MCPSMKCLLQDQHEQRKRPSDNPSRRSSPLWPMSSGRPSETDVPKCSYCGGPCCFELQIMPQLLHKFGMENGVNSLDWSTIVIYTCEASCDESIAYKEEFAWVQPPFQ